jgi:hypothetical protein
MERVLKRFEGKNYNIKMYSKKIVFSVFTVPPLSNSLCRDINDSLRLTGNGVPEQKSSRKRA